MSKILDEGKVKDFRRGFQATNRGVTGMKMTYTVDHLVRLEKYRKRTLVDTF